MTMAFGLGLIAVSLGFLIVRAFTGRWVHRLALASTVVCAVPLALAVARCRASAASPTDPLVECLGPAPLYALLGLGVGVLINIMASDAEDARAQAQQSACDWTKAAVLLEEGWDFDSGLLRGTYQGYRVEARAVNSPRMGPYDPGECRYEVMLHADLGRDRWLVRGGQRRREVLRGPEMVAQRLERTGVLDLVRTSMRCVAFATVRYSPRTGKLTYSDGTGRVPSPQVFREHLEMLLKVATLETVGSAARWPR